MLFLKNVLRFVDSVCFVSFFENVLGSVDNEITPFPHLSSSRRPLEYLNKDKGRTFPFEIVDIFVGNIFLGPGNITAVFGKC